MMDELRPENLKRGMEAFLARPNWPNDFHAAFYLDLRDLQSDGLTMTWWNGVVDHLWSWIAIRPKSKDFIRERGASRLPDLARECAALSSHARASDTDLASVDWNSVAGLFEVAHAIKGVSSPVFGSKLCHFLHPHLFPVYDNEVLSFPSANYREYWEFCRAQWSGCEIKQVLIDTLAPFIPSEAATEFPWSTKITELCNIGSKDSESSA